MWSIGSLIGNAGRVFKEFRMNMVDVCRLQDVRWRGWGSKMLGMEGRGFELSWCGGVGVERAM